MRKLILPTGAGKTDRLIKASASTWCYMVVHTIEDAVRVSRRALELGLDIPHPVTYWEFKQGNYYAKGIKGFLIDNADMLLQYLSTVPVVGISINNDSLCEIQLTEDQQKALQPLSSN